MSEDLITQILEGKLEVQTTEQLVETMEKHFNLLIADIQECSDAMIKENDKIDKMGSYMFWIIKRIARLEVNQAYVVRQLIVINSERAAASFKENMDNIIVH